MNPDAVIEWLMANPVTATAIAGAVASVGAFFRPIMRAVQRAAVRRINQAWIDDAWEQEESEPNHKERVRKAAKRVFSQTLMPVSQEAIEDRVSKEKSEPPPPS